MKPGIAAEISSRLRQLGDPDKALLLQRFFKTGPGEYAEGDLFIGVTVPRVRSLLREYPQLTPVGLLPLLTSGIHEERLFALLSLVRSFEKGALAEREQIYSLYLANTPWINNWDLVDCSAPRIVGGFLLKQGLQPLDLLARSASLWERRIAIVATFAFIRSHQFAETLQIARILLNDREDLIHKAVGWMLREVGKLDVVTLERFLIEYCRTMPRTMLRYAIEKFPEEQRKAYLAGTTQAE
jgi:3-methyladenine DNA glycosylase AlkD